MRKDSIDSEVRRRLLRAGFGRSYANRAALELQQHWEEIVGECRQNGISQAEAESEASNRLGAPESLINEFTARLQRSTWLGRHPTLGFGILALMLTLLWWTAFGSLAASLCGLFSWDPKAQGSIQPRLDILSICFDWIRATSYLIVPWLCCHVAARYFCGWRPALWACLIVAVHNSMNFLTITEASGHGTVAWGYSFRFESMPPLLAIVAPLAVFGLYRAWSLREEQHDQDSGPTFC